MSGCPYLICVISFVPTCMFHYMNPSFALYPVNVVIINHLAYTDDIVILSSSYSEMQGLLEAVIRHAAAGEQRQAVLLEGEPLEDVDKFEYLSSMFVANGQGTEEIRSRINLARSAFSRLQCCLWSRREISLRTKGSVNQAVVRSILLYGCETWPVRVADERMLEVFDNDSIRRILRVRRRLGAIRGTASPPLPYKHTGTARAKKAPLVWSCCKTSRKWAE